VTVTQVLALTALDVCNREPGALALSATPGSAS
jgi:hypothetical protein